MNKMAKAGEHDAQYEAVFGDVSKIIDTARESAVRSVNAAMTAAYWLVGHRIVEFEQSGEERAEYGTALIERLAADLTQRFGRGFSRQNMSRAATKRTTVAVDVQGNWTLRILSGISEGICNTMVQSGGEFLYIGVGGR